MTPTPEREGEGRRVEYFQAGANLEREAIVDWLRSLGVSEIGWVIEAIERGDHLK